MHTIRSLAIAAVAITLGACGATTAARTTTVESGGSVVTGGGVTPAVVIPEDNRSLPVGATLVARLDQTLGTKESKAGDRFTATVADALTARNGSVVIPAGAKIEGRVTAVDDSDNAGEPALIRLDFDRISFGGQSYPFAASITQSSPRQSGGASTDERNRNIIIGGAVGAALGAILGDKDLKNIVIGGALGAAAGSIISLGTEVNATLPAGSTMTLRTTQNTVLR